MIQGGWHGPKGQGGAEVARWPPRTGIGLATIKEVGIALKDI